MLKTLHRLLALGMLAGVSLIAAPQLQQGSIVNAASFAVDGAPNSPIAQGSLFTVFGVDVGPATAAEADQFPLPTTLGGVSIKVTAGGLDFDCIILFAVNSQVSAILPSNVPAGEATLVLTYNGEASNAITFTVAERMPGVFSRSSTGSGQTVVQNYVSPTVTPANGINDSAKPGQVMILWTTGIGKSLNGDDRNAPAPGNLLPLDQIKVYVGGKEAVVEYAGRSGCCAGVDQINFIVPADVEGCYVPVVVVINGIPSNFTTMAITGEGGYCEGAYGLSKADVETLLSKQTIRTGIVALTRTSVEVLGQTINTSNGFASFNEFTQSGFVNAGSSVGDAPLAPGSCLVATYSYDPDGTEAPLPPELEDIFQVKELDAGAQIFINGPNGQRTLPKVLNSTGNYSGSLSNPLNPLENYLIPGAYNVNNGAGGGDVGAFDFTANVQSFYPWTNKAAIANIARSQPLTLTWDPGNDPQGLVAIFGYSFSLPKKVASSVFCYASPDAGTFTIPAFVLSGMVESDSTGSGPVPLPAGNLSFGVVNDAVPFTAPNLDLGVFAVSALESKQVDYQ